MDRENNSSSEALQKGTQAASMISSAVKTSKAVASASNEAIVGGLYGAAAGFIRENKAIIGKIIIAVVAFLMIPVMMLCMLPSLIFGGITNAFSPDDPESPILNNNTVITENLAKITAAVDKVFSESKTALLVEIETDFFISKAEYKEIIDPYIGTNPLDIYQFIGQYCASKAQSPELVSIPDMENVLRSNKDNLYTYTRIIEDREVDTVIVVTDPDTGEQTEITIVSIEKWAVYSITYCGDTYFANDVFNLTDEQKSLADDYAQNLKLFIGE